MNSHEWVKSTLSEEKDECILYPFYLNNGYPRIHIKLGKGNYTKVYANQFVCEKVYGPKPEGDYAAAHSCGVKRCVNKRHLRWASRSENEKDKIIHGTSNRGERHGRNKLTEDDVREIIKSEALGIPRSLICAKFEISASTIHDIINGYTWSWFTGIERQDYVL